MNKLFILGFLILFSCNSHSSRQMKANNDSKKNVSISSKTISNTPPREDILYESINKDALVIGDSTRKIISYVAIKFEPHILFSDFPSDSLLTKPDSVNFMSNPLGKRFKTKIKETVEKEGVNFGGHYCFVYWGCGAPCQQSVVIDLLTGKIYYGPSAGLGYEFRKNSRMLIINPPNHYGTDIFHPQPDFYLDCPYCKPEINIWIESKNQFEKR